MAPSVLSGLICIQKRKEIFGCNSVVMQFRSFGKFFNIFCYADYFCFGIFGDYVIKAGVELWRKNSLSLSADSMVPEGMR